MILYSLVEVNDMGNSEIRVVLHCFPNMKIGVLDEDRGFGDVFVHRNA